MNRLYMITVKGEGLMLNMYNDQQIVSAIVIVLWFISIVLLAYTYVRK